MRVANSIRHPSASQFDHASHARSRIEAETRARDQKKTPSHAQIIVGIGRGEGGIRFQSDGEAGGDEQRQADPRDDPEDTPPNLTERSFFRGRVIENAIPDSRVTMQVLVWANEVLLIAWGLIYLAFQPLLNKSRRDDGIQLGWRIADVATLVLLLLLDALMSPLTVAFPVLIVASAFWSRATQIIQSTLLSIAGYCLLILVHWRCHGALPNSYRHFHYLVALAILCLILVDQANRTRALARIGGARLRV
jgi:hypothetical protein